MTQMTPSTNKKMSANMLDPKILKPAIRDTFKKLDPRLQVSNFVMFVVYLGAILCTIAVCLSFGSGVSKFDLQITIWLWLTVLFANFAESIAEGQGKAQAESLRKARDEGVANRRKSDGTLEKVSFTQLRAGDLVECGPGDTIAGDGEVIEGIATVDESSITGESAPVVRESGGDRSAVTGGTRVISDKVVVKIAADPGESFLDKLIELVEGANRRKTPNEIALTILLVSLTVVFFLAVATLKIFFDFSLASSPGSTNTATLTVLIALLVCLIPTTIGGLLSAIGISGMDRLLRKNVVATSGRAVEAAGDIDVLLLDKTGTITLGNRMATDFWPAPGLDQGSLAEAAFLSSLSDGTPEGRSIVVLAKNKFGHRSFPVAESQAEFIEFSAETRMSGVNLPQAGGKPRMIRKGAADAVQEHVEKNGGVFPKDVNAIVERIAREGGTPLVVSENNKVLGVIQLKDVVKRGIKERFAELRRMGIRTVMITGDNPLTAAAIAAEAGVDDFIAKATPETKLRRIRDEQAQGHMVAMIGDGTNDAPALAQADIGVAMNSGTQAAREAGNMVDLDSNPTKLIEIVETGKQLLMTRGALTTFSIANDIAKYFAILPAMLGGLYLTHQGKGALHALDVMRLHSYESAILSAVIFNALIIIALVPLALKGVKYVPRSAPELLRRNLFIYGLGGVLAPFVGIKILDLIVAALGWV